MAMEAYVWCVLGLALQCQLLLADQPSNKEGLNGGVMSQNKNIAPNSDNKPRLTKRYTDGDGSVMDDGGDGLYDVDPYSLYSLYAPDTLDDSEMADSSVDKRHNSRWSLIQRKLAELNGNKRDYDKRQDSRWLIIQNKLNELQNKHSKRGFGRWKNTKWSMGKYSGQ